jgi:photosystem II stability/assembly factor-like uncharacterized protein
MRTLLVILAISCSAFLWAGSSVWTNIGPDGGTARGLVIDPNDPNILYALTGAGLFKSADAGSSWSIAAPLPANSGRILSLVIDPQHTNVLYAATFEASGAAPGDWVFKSTDAGASWRTLKSGLPSGLTAPLAIDPQDPQTIYSGGYNDILKSTDGGETWKTIDAGLPSLGCCIIVRSLAIDPQDPAIVYAVTGIGIFKSSNRGASWTTVYRYSGQSTDPQFASIAIDPLDSNTLYGLRIGLGGVYKSTDGGSSWREANAGLPSGPDETISTNAIVVHPQKSRSIYAVTSGGIYSSTDGAESWSALSSGMKDVSALAIDAQNPDIFYAGTRTGIFKSTDGGASWRSINSGLRAIEIRRLAFLPDDPGVLYAYNFATSFKTTGQGTSWTEGKFPYPLAIGSQDPATMFAVTTDGLAKSADGGATFTPSHDGLPEGFCHGVTSVAIDPEHSDTVYAGVSSVPCSGSRGGGVWKSVDGAASWTKLEGQPDGGGVYGLTIDPQRPATVYSWNGKGAFKSLDGGKSWNKLRCGPVDRMVIDPGDSNILYAVLNDESSVFACDHDPPGIYRSTDGGASWTAINSGLGTIRLNFLRTDVITAVVIDPAETGTLYAGTNENGVFRSRDAGGSWTALNSGLTALAVYALALDQQDGSKLYAGTAGGVFSLDLEH